MINVAPPNTSPAADAAEPDGAASLRERLAVLLRRNPVRIRFDAREMRTAAGIYLAVAAIGFGILLALSAQMGFPVGYLLHRWDSDNYLSIARYGYPHRLSYLPDGVPRWSTLAFFPLMPALIRAAHLTGLPFEFAGVLVSWSAAVLAAAGVQTLVSSVAGRRVGYACVGLWACSPYAFALWVPYSEACFSAALLWALICLAGRRWIAAGALTAVAGTLRPTASVLVCVVLGSAGWALLRRRDGWRPWAGMLLAPLGLVFSWLYLGAQVGRLNGWFEAERAWGQTFDFGRGTAYFLDLVIFYRRHADIRYAAVIALILLVAVGVMALALDRRVPWPMVLALAGAWLLVVGTPGSPLSKPRFMLPFLPLLLLLPARPLSRLPRLVQGSLYASGAVFAGWYSVGLLLVFRWSP
jgi:hypothetical protein